MDRPNHDQHRCGSGDAAAVYPGRRYSYQVGFCADGYPALQGSHYIAAPKTKFSEEHMTHTPKRRLFRSSLLATLLLGLCQTGQAHQASTDAPAATSVDSAVTFFQNVRIFNGTSATLSKPSNDLVRTTDQRPTDGSATTQIIDGGGRTLMPGLIDTHWHTMMVRPTVAQLLTADVGYLNLMAGAEATATLMRGFTTVRDLGGPAFGLKRAAVEAAGNWGTYVTVHAYTPVSIQRAIAAGVKCIEHGHLMDDATARLIAEQGVWLSTQVFPDEMANAFPPGSPEQIKALEVFAGTDKTIALAKKYNIKMALGTDLLFSPGLAPLHGSLLAKWVQWYTPAELLVMATGSNAQLLALSGKRNPYPGKLGGRGGRARRLTAC
jgi:imidazolonepropionase-like amidohydrolase